MFKLSKRNSSGSDFEHSVMPSAANSSRGVTDVQRELVRVAFKDTLRSTGVPAQWLDCEVQYAQISPHEEQVQVQLRIKKWSGHLLRYSLAFQNELMQCLDRYEPHVDHSKFVWLWQYDAECETPFPEMPPRQEWARKLEATYELPAVAPRSKPAVAPAAVSAPAPVSDKAFELRDIFSDLTVDTLKAR